MFWLYTTIKIVHWHKFQQFVIQDIWYIADIFQQKKILHGNKPFERQKYFK